MNIFSLSALVRSFLLTPGHFFMQNLHYYTALVDRVQDASRIISSLGDKNAELCGQVEELKAGARPEAVAAAKQRAINLEGKVAWLKLELEGTGQQ